MEEGRQIEGGNVADSSSKVVRLPRDWLGPREELVPFGKATPSADDFWGGEPTVAIHAPGDQTSASAPAGAPQSFLPRSRLRHALVAAAASVVGIAAAAAVGFLSAGSQHAAAGPRLNMAALLDTGVSKILGGGPPRVVSRQRPARTVRRLRHRARLTKPAPPRARHPSSPRRVAPTYTARVSPATSAAPTTTYRARVSEPTPRVDTSPHVDTSPPPAHSTPSSTARVTPTGQAGALGPVHSPNG